MTESGGAISKNPKRHQPPTWQERLAALPSTSFAAGETVVRQGTKTGRLLILKSGAVRVVKDGIEIATATEPGVVFGELSALLDEPHTADVRTIEPSEFHVADANILTHDPAALLYVATLLARRLDLANGGLTEIKNELAADASPSMIRTTLGKIESVLSSIGAGYITAGAAHAMNPFM
jgi:CRP/FNR family transcriptional regulator, cyclic AMP receptor protein